MLNVWGVWSAGQTVKIGDKRYTLPELCTLFSAFLSSLACVCEQIVEGLFESLGPPRQRTFTVTCTKERIGEEAEKIVLRDWPKTCCAKCRKAVRREKQGMWGGNDNLDIQRRTFPV